MKVRPCERERERNNERTSESIGRKSEREQSSEGDNKKGSENVDYLQRGRGRKRVRERAIKCEGGKK